MNQKIKMLDKIKTNYLKNKKPLIIILVLWLIFSIASIWTYRLNYGKESFGIKKQDSIVELNRDTIISETFEVIDKVDAISLNLTNYGRINRGNLYIEVKGDISGTVYGSITADVSKIDPDRFNSYALSTSLDYGKDKTVTIKITSDCDSNNSLGIFMGNVDDDLSGTYRINGNSEDGLLCIRLMSPNKGLTAFVYVIASMISVIGFVVILMIFLLEPEKEVIFTTMVLLLGLIMIVVITPLSGADEDYHYRQTLRLSNQLMGKNVSQIEDRYISTYGFETMFNTASGYKSILEIYDMKMDLEGRNIYPLKEPPVYVYNLDYLPAALGVTVARLFPLNYLWTCYLGRLGNLLFYAICIYFAIKKTPVFKTMFGIVATTVMFMQMAFTYGQDGWICSLSMLMFAYFLDWMFGEEKITLKDYIILLIIDLLLAPAKTVYSLFAILFLFVPAERFANKKYRNIMVAVLMLPMIKEVGSNIMQRISGLLFQTIHADTMPVREAISPVLNSEPFGVSYIVTHINETIAIIIRTIRANATTWIYGMFGRYLSSLSLTLPLNLSRLTMILVLLSALIKEKNTLSIPIKITTLMICAAIAGLTIIMMLVGWTNTDDVTIQGIQGRYFSPFEVYFMSIFNNKKITIPSSTDRYMIVAQLCIIASTLFYVLSYTFVNF